MYMILILYSCNILDNNYNFIDFDKNSYIKLERIVM